MTEENETPGKEETPHPSHEDAPRQEQVASESARKNMADKIEGGRTPYDYSAEIGEDSPEHAGGGGAGFILAMFAVLLSLAALLAVSYIGWNALSDVSGKIDGMSGSMERLSGQLSAQSESSQRASRAVVRAELRKTRKILDRVKSLGGAENAHKAAALQEEIDQVMDSLGGAKTGTAETAPAPAAVTPEPTGFDYDDKAAREAEDETATPEAPTLEAPSKMPYEERPEEPSIGPDADTGGLEASI